MNDLNKLGLTEEFRNELLNYDGYYVGRVSSQSRDLYKVLTEDMEVIAEVSGKFRNQANSIIEFPAVGDFVMLDRIDDDEGHAIIHHVLTRKSAIVRKAAGTSHEEQVVAANVDIVFICMSLNSDFNLRRIERYLSLVWDSGAIPIIVLTKADLSNDLTEKLISINEVAIGVDVIVSVIDDGSGLIEISNKLSEGKTATFIGSSGVGKSTIINRLLGEDVLQTQGLRDDDKGRHTTTHRELFIAENGGIVIDTPGMREVGLDNVDISRTFEDIDQLASLCKFNDCSHTNVPKCAIRQAIEEGKLSEDRFESYLKLQKESQYEGLNSREIERVKLDNMFSEFGGMKNARKSLKHKFKEKNRFNP